MAYKPWEVQENLWKESCNQGKHQNKAFLVDHLSKRNGKSILETLQDLKFAERSGLLRTNADGTVDIR